MSAEELAKVLREECSRRELRRLRRGTKRGIRRLMQAIGEFQALGYETDTSDLADFLGEALELRAALEVALMTEPTESWT